MSSDYPRLPSHATSKAERNPTIFADETIAVPKALPTRQRQRAKDAIIVPESTRATPIVISFSGDIILEYAELSSGKLHYWQVSTERLMIGSPYFGAMLDSDKFMEGRLLAQQRQALKNDMASRPSETSPNNHEVPLLAELPIVKVPSSTKLDICGVEAVQLFLKILCLDASETEARHIFYDDLAAQSPSIVSKVIDIAEWFNSTTPIRAALLAAQYRGGIKSKTGTKVFNPDMLKLKERRIREMIFISSFLGLDDLLKAMTHTLIIVGSRYWLQGPERPMAEEYPTWQYLPNGIEEEIYYRRQCVMNTLTDLQAHFLRSYGGLEKDEPNPKSANLGAAFSSRALELQCRNGLDNGMQCDIFHLGTMTRFFTLRTKTIFLGSTLVDPEFNGQDSGEEILDEENGTTRAGEYQEPQFAINQVIASLKQYPDYQIDSNHVGCGIRRRLLPILDGIEKFTADNRGLLGIQGSMWESAEMRASSAWSGKGGPKDHTVEIRFAKITKIEIPASGPLKQFMSPEDQARFMFTAAKYKWEA